MYSVLEVGRMRKGHNSRVDLTHTQICPTVTRNTLNIVRPKQRVPKEIMPYPNMKTSQILGRFVSE
jgi:hypothetical protein